MIDPTPLSQATQKVFQAEKPSHDPISQSFRIKRSNTRVDLRLLQFLLNDFVGGGKGYHLDLAVDFLKRYLDRYVDLWPQDIHVKTIQTTLKSYIYQADVTKSLTEAATEIWQRLEETGYVALGGGVLDGDGGGHALFYEFSKDIKELVTFQVTNSGDGLQYHPKDNNGAHYRTLVYSGATLADLKQMQFLELLLNFTRIRPALRQLNGVIPELLPQRLSVHDVYLALQHGWPGKGPFLAKNLGKAQRGKSCSLQALMKWLKGVCDRNQHPWLTLWIKLSAFSDYLDNEPEHSAQFIADASRKISTHIDKMDKQNAIPPSLLEVWEEISQRGLTKRSAALSREACKRASEALSATVTGLGLESYQIVQLAKPSDSQKLPPAITPYIYPHAFPGEKAPLAELPTLSGKDVAPLFDEMSYRMNIIRLLPNCLQWDVNKRETLEQLGSLLPLFFYMKNPAPSLQVPDSFCADLLNMWMGIYLEAKREGEISREVLLEWMNGASILIENYTPELRFDSPQSREKWTMLANLIENEKKLLSTDLGEHYKPPKNYWTVWNQNFNAPDYNWMPFGIFFKQKNTSNSRSYTSSDETLKELPEMAHFSRRILQKFATSPVCITEWNEGKDTPDQYLMRQAKNIEKWDHCRWSTPTLSEPLIAINKAIDAFACRLLCVPYYDVLREGLAALFVLTDRHLSKKRSTPEGHLITLLPNGRDIGWTRNTLTHPCIQSIADTTTRLKHLKEKPECILLKTEVRWKSLQDLNQRVQGILLDAERQFPFMTSLEEQEFLIFVQKEPVTRLAEMLVFFKKCLHKLSIPAYQTTFEHLLFSKEGGELLEQLFQQEPASIALLFQFFERGYDALLKEDPKVQPGAAALLHSHMNIVQLSCLYKHPNQQLHRERLFKNLEKLITAGQKNPILGKALGQAVFAALPALEFIYPQLQQHPEFLQTLTTTCLLECKPGDYTQTPYSRLQLQYGWNSFKALLTRDSYALTLWQKAAERVFGKEESSVCLWDPIKDRLKLKTLEIDLGARCIAGGDELNMRLIPEPYRGYQFEKLFGKRNFFANERIDEGMQIYAFSWEKASYELRIHLLTEQKYIYKKFGNAWYSIEKNELPGALGKDQYSLWRCEAEYLVENKHTHEVVAGGTETRLQRYADSEKLEESLVVFDPAQTTFLRTLFERLQSSVQVWADPATNRIQRIELPCLQLQFCREVDTNYLKNRDFDQEAPQVFCLERATIADRQGASEGKKSGVKPTPSKTDSSGSLCIHEGKERVQSIQFPGFFIAEEQHVAFLKSFRSALILENALRQKKVIVPLWSFENTPYQPYIEDSTFSTTDSSGEEKDNHPYLTFDLENAGSMPVFSPRPCHQASITWLISLYLHTREYRTALDLIEQTRVTSQRSISPLTKTILENASTLGQEPDTHPHAVALRVRLRAWHGQLAGLDRSQDLDRYNNLRNAMGPFALSPKEFPEISYCSPRSPVERLDSTRQLDRLGWSAPLPQKLREKIVQSYNLSLQSPPALTVIGEDFILNFLNHYETIRYGKKDDREWKCLSCILYFTCNDPSPLISCLSRILLYAKSKYYTPDLHAMFQLEEAKFQCEFDSFLKIIFPCPYPYGETIKLEYPTSKRSPIVFKPQGQQQSIEPRDARYVDAFEPLPPLASLFCDPLLFEPLEKDLIVRRTVNVTTEAQAVEALSLWAEKESARVATEPVLQASFERLRRGALQLQKEIPNKDKEEEALSTDSAIREAVLGRYKQEIDTRRAALKVKERAILDKANDLHNQSHLHLEIGRELRAPLDIETLLISLGRKEISVIRNANPSLSNQETTQLMHEVAEYAYLRGDLQQLVRAQRSLLEAPEGYLNAARASRCYDPTKAPELLVFEVLSDLILRKEQVEALKGLTPGTLFEARTGFGKSKVLLPLWLLLTSQESLAIFISPAFDDQERYLQGLLQKAYHFFGTSIEFTRDSPASFEEITFIHKEMQRAERLRRPVFMSTQTAHNLFVLKLKELAQRGGQLSVISSQALQALLSLRRYVKDKRVFIDEPHKGLDDRQEYNYSIGMPEAIDPKRLQFEIDLYRNLFSLIKGRYQIECWPCKGKSPLTEELYRSGVLAPLLDLMISATSEERPYLLGELNLDAQQQFEQALTQTQDPKRGAYIRSLHDQLHYYLPQTLQRHCDEHYALGDPQGERIAIPLEDARNPRQGNEFVSIDQMLNFTIQANLKTPFSEEYLHNYLQELGKLAAEEAHEKATPLKNTQAYQHFLLLTKEFEPPPSGLLTLKPEEFVRIHAHLNLNIEAKLQLIHFHVLPKVRHFHEKVSSSPHLLVHCFDQVVGTSATLSMQHFPHTCKTAVDERSMARTIVALLKKDDPVVELPETDSLCPLPYLREQFPDASVVIEVGAVLRHYPQIEGIAQEILRLYPLFKGVATFDAAGHPVVITKNSTVWTPVESSGIPRAQLFWFYGQKDTTGRDEKMENTAIAVVLVNQHTTLTHLIQGVGRMRGILNGQCAKIAMDNESSLCIRRTLNKSREESLTLLDLISYCAEQEGKGNGLANFRSLSLQLDALIENFFWDGILTPSVSQGQLDRELKEIRHYLVQSTKDEPLLRPSLTLHPVDTTQALEKLMSAYHKKIQAIQELKKWTLSQIDPTYMEKTREHVQNNMLYPNKVYLHHTLGSSQIVETTSAQAVVQQKTTTTAANTETFAADETETISEQFAWSSLLKGKDPLPRTPEINPHSLSSVLSHPSLKKYQPLFANTQVHISQNALCTFTGDSVQQPGWMNGYTKPLHYIVQLLNGRYVLIDTQEAAQVLKEPDSVRLLWLVNHGPLIHKPESAKNFQQIEIDAKLLNGDLDFSEEQQSHFDAWISQQNRVLLQDFATTVLKSIKKP